MNKLPKFQQEQHLAQSLKTPHALEIYEKLFIGSQIKKLRIKAAMTQGDLAKKLKTSQSVIARIENGKQNLTIRTLVVLSVLFGKKISIRFH
ncbi:MAG: helix-turn-helix transcriptional regulator [Patescibacteria group bacterium]